jgi:hypothetical protein
MPFKMAIQRMIPPGRENPAKLLYSLQRREVRKEFVFSFAAEACLGFSVFAL